MKTIRFDNLSDHEVQLIVEPWAWAGAVGREGVVEITDPGDDADRVEFALTKDGSPLIAILTERVRIQTAHGEFEFGSNPIESKAD